MRALALLALPLLACSNSPGAGVCVPDCGQGRSCCGSTCVNPFNDPKNCGGCGTTCSGATPLCEGGACKAAPCERDGGSCSTGALCCGADCCTSGQLCCSSDGPVSGGPPSCFTPTASSPSCPQGCAPLCVSDQALKRAPAAVDERQVLERVSALPISTWSYTFDPPTARHIGPMAQDFHDAFSLGSSDKSYDPIDAHGVSLAAIKALNQLMVDQEARIRKLELENAALRQGVCR